jgi:hypothetical protein
MVLTWCNGATVTWNRRILNVLLFISAVACLLFPTCGFKEALFESLKFLVFSGVCVFVCVLHACAVCVK